MALSRKTSTGALKRLALAAFGLRSDGEKKDYPWREPRAPPSASSAFASRSMKAWVHRQRPLLIAYHIVQHCWAHKSALDKVRNRKPSGAISTLSPPTAPRPGEPPDTGRTTCPKAVTCLHDDDPVTCFR